MGRVITGVTLDSDGVTLTYVTLPADLRENGLAAQHMLTVPADDNYADEIETLIEAASALLEDALEDFEKVPAFEPVMEDEEGDDDDD